MESDRWNVMPISAAHLPKMPLNCVEHCTDKSERGPYIGEFAQSDKLQPSMM